MKSNTIQVVKIGGKVLEDPTMLDEFLVAFHSLPFPKILVHGGGKKASLVSQRLGIKTRMIEGRRITDTETLEVALMVYAGLVNKQLVAALQAMDVDAIGLTGADADCIRSVRRPPGEVDFGFVGDITRVNHDFLADLLSNGQVPVLAPVTHDGEGQLLNTNADTIASHTATAISTHAPVILSYCFEYRGVLLDAGNPDGQTLSTIKTSEMMTLENKGLIHSGMLPKLQNALLASKAGVEKVFICGPSNLACKTDATQIISDE